MSVYNSCQTCFRKVLTPSLFKLAPVPFTELFCRVGITLLSKVAFRFSTYPEFGCGFWVPVGHYGIFECFPDFQGMFYSNIAVDFIMPYPTRLARSCSLLRSWWWLCMPRLRGMLSGHRCSCCTSALHCLYQVLLISPWMAPELI